MCGWCGSQDEPVPSLTPLLCALCFQIVPLRGQLIQPVATMP